MKNKLIFLTVVLCTVFFTQCSKENPTQTEEIGLETQNDDNFKGKIRINNSLIQYTASAKEDLVFDIAVVIDKKTIDAVVNYKDESIQINGYDNILSASQKEALLKTGSFIADYLLDTKKGDIAMIEYTLLSFLEYWGKSPENYMYSKRSILTSVNTTNLKSRNEGVTCIRRNTVVNAEYDDSRGNQRDRVRVGSKPRANYGCMGRCGGDCGRWWIPSAWTKDCMDHDQCSHINNASGGSGDRNCGDEFNEAADDYIFGVIRGCRG